MVAHADDEGMRATFHSHLEENQSCHESVEVSWIELPGRIPGRVFRKPCILETGDRI